MSTDRDEPDPSAPLGPAPPAAGPDPAGPQFLGDYRLVELLGEGPLTRSWLAEQASVGRTVVVEELRGNAPESRARFVADIRAKASVGHPLIGSVYEAVTSDGHCFFARERLAGPTLAERAEARATLRPVELAAALRRIAEAQLHLEGRALAATPLSLADIHLDERGVVRINNLVTAGTREPDRSAADIAGLGNALGQLVADGHPGTTRMLTLLGWMAGTDPAVPPLGWRKVHDYANQIDQQLAEPLPPLAPPTSPARRILFGRHLALWLGAAAILAVAATLAWVALRPGKPPPRGLPGVVHVPAGRHPTPDGGRNALPDFWISCHEVTIGEYDAFLQALDRLAPEQRATYDHEDQPPAKADHQPDDWPAMLAAARAGARWNNLPLSPDCPVVGVDWWDACAFCEWKRGRLPSQEEWFAALNHGSTAPPQLAPSPWGPAASHPADRTPAGIHDLAGSVAEWTRKPAINPALPTAGRKTVIAGASHVRPDGAARAREWTDDRSLRRPDLGFRITYDYPPTE